MTRTSKTPKTSTKHGNLRVPEPFRMISSATTRKRTGKAAVPELVLSGEWLKAVGFPIGSAAILTTDRRGELALHRLGLGFPGRLSMRAAPR
jgi:hypothetical protein